LMVTLHAVNLMVTLKWLTFLYTVYVAVLAL